MVTFEVLFEAFRQESGGLGLRAVLFECEPEGPKSIRDIAEVTVIGPPENCYCVDHLARVVHGWLHGADCEIINEGVDYGRIKATRAKLMRAGRTVAAYFAEHGHAWVAPPPSETPVVLHWLTEHEWQAVQAMRKAGEN